MNHKFDLDYTNDRYMIGTRYDHDGELGAFGAVARRSTFERAIKRAEELLALKTDDSFVVEIYRDGDLMESYHN